LSRRRLRFGGDEEAFWGDYFNGFKEENPWAVDVPPERLTESRPVTVLGVEVAQRERRLTLSRPFMARFGDIRPASTLVEVWGLIHPDLVIEIEVDAIIP